MVSTQNNQMAQFFASMTERMSGADLDLATIRDVYENLHLAASGSARLSPPTIPHRRLNRGLIEPSCQIRRGVNHNEYQHH